MKKLLLSLSFLGALTVSAQDCSQLFISEYSEGWSNNKALEIYNPTNNAIDLSQYFVARYSNGATSATVANAVQLSGIVAPHDVHVAVVDKRDPNGVNQEAPVWDSLQAKADGFYSPVYNTSDAFYWNGNDAILLAKGTLPSTPTTVINATNVTGFMIIDIFGKIGENPGNGTDPLTGWTCDFPYVQAGAGATVDHSMIRKPSIKKGVNTMVSFFNPLLEWDTIPAVVVRLDANGDTLFGTSGNAILDGNWNSLGHHDCACNPASVDEISEASLNVFPNPSNGIVNVKNNGDLKSIVVINSLGQTVASIPNVTNKSLISFNLDDLHGVYFLRITNSNGNQSLRKVILK